MKEKIAILKSEIENDYRLFILKEPLHKDINNFLDFLESLKREYDK
ncbi:MAG: hypothetical protein HUU08_13200 [Candidatus Brocadia sp.]|nr:hypothetical protein [Candidatus Brocadia sp.]